MMHELPDAPTLEVKIGRPELLRHNRWNAGYFEERFRQNEKKLKILHSVPLGDFIADELPDGSSRADRCATCRSLTFATPGLTLP